MESILSQLFVFNFQWFLRRDSRGRGHGGEAGHVHCDPWQCIGGRLGTLVSHSNYFEDFTAGVACVPRCEYTCMVSFVGTPKSWQ